VALVELLSLLGPVLVVIDAERLLVPHSSGTLAIAVAGKKLLLSIPFFMRESRKAASWEDAEDGMLLLAAGGAVVVPSDCSFWD